MVNCRLLELLWLLLLLLGPGIKGLLHDARLTPVTGDCTKIAPLSPVNPSQVHGKEWTIMYDSHNPNPDEPEDMCESFTLRWDGKFMHTTEILFSKESKEYVRINMHFEADARKKGFYFDRQGGAAVILNIGRRAEILCWMECSPMEEGHGAHVFCGSRSGQWSRDHELTYQKTVEALPSMGVDVEMKPVNSDCEVMNVALET